MKNKKWMAILLGGIMAASLAAPCSVSAAEKTTLTFWHAMGGTNGEVLQQIVDDFNASQDEIEIKAEYQGTYDDTITKLKAAMQSESGLPDVCQMYDVGTKFMYDSGAVIPVEDKFESTGYDKSSVMGVISSYYTVDGKQYSMPFNVSTPMLYYNKDVFEAAGLDPAAFFSFLYAKEKTGKFPGFFVLPYAIAAVSSRIFSISRISSVVRLPAESACTFS